jgi:hypothetical protein
VCVLLQSGCGTRLRTRLRNNQSDKGQASKQRRGDKRAAGRAANKVEEHFSEEELAAAADKVPFCPSHLSAGSLVTSASADQPGFLTEVVEGGNIKGQEAVNQVSARASVSWLRAWVDGTYRTYP